MSYYQDFKLEIDPNTLKDNESLLIQLDTNIDDDIKYIDITKTNGRTNIHLKSQSYAIQEAAKLGKQRGLFQNYLNERFNNLNPDDQDLALKIMKEK